MYQIKISNYNRDRFFWRFQVPFPHVELDQQIFLLILLKLFKIKKWVSKIISTGTKALLTCVYNLTDEITFIPSTRNMSQTLRSVSQGKVRMKTHRNQGVIYKIGSIVCFFWNNKWQKKLVKIAEVIQENLKKIIFKYFDPRNKVEIEKVNKKK